MDDAADTVAGIEHSQDPGNSEGCGHHADHLEQLLAPRCRPDDMTALEVLHVVAGDGSCRTDQARQIDHGDRSERSRPGRPCPSAAPGSGPRRSRSRW